MDQPWVPRLLISCFIMALASVIALYLIRVDGISVFWPSNGVFLALMITAPRKRWPAYIFAGVVSSVLAHLSMGYKSPTVFGLSLANAVEIWIAAWPFRNLAPERPDLTHMRWLGRLVLFGAFLAPTASALVAVFMTGNYLSYYSLLVRFELWITNDGVGIILFAPLTLALVDPALLELFRRRQLPKTLALLALVLLIATLCFGQSRYSFPLLVVVGLIPVVFVLGLPGAAIGVLLTAIPAIGFTRNQVGPFSIFKPLYASFFLQIYFSTLLGTVYVLAAVLAKEKRLADELRESEMRYRVLAETSQDLIVRTTLIGIRTYVSPSLLQVTGWVEEELPPPSSFSDLVHPSDKPAFTAFLRERQTEPGQHSLVFRFRKRGGNYAWLEARVGTVFNRDNVPFELVWTMRDISLRIEHEENLKNQMQSAHVLASTDGLTGLKNRRTFDEVLEAEWTKCLERGDVLSVLMLDVDQFKLFNDSYGHPAGDECLRQISAVIRECIRQSGDVAARYGGEEFAVILPRADIQRAELIADRIRERVEKLAIDHASSANGVVTLSAGVASGTPGCGTLAESLVQQADESLYAAKRAGRNRVVLWA